MYHTDAARVYGHVPEEGLGQAAYHVGADQAAGLFVVSGLTTASGLATRSGLATASPLTRSSVQAQRLKRSTNAYWVDAVFVSSLLRSVD